MAEEKNELGLVPQSGRGALRRLDHGDGYGYSDEDRFGYDDRSEQGGGGFDFRLYLRQLRRHLVLIVALAVLGGALATVYMYRFKTLYTSAAIVDIGRESNIAVTADQLLTSGDVSNAGALVDTKRYILELTSEPVLEEVVVKLNLDRDPSFLDVDRKNSYTEVAAILASKVGLGASPEVVTADVEVVDAPLTPNVERTGAELENLDKYVRTLRSNLDITQVRETRALRIAFTHTDPEIAAAVANGLAQTLVDKNFENRTAQYASTSAWLERTTADLKSRAEAAEQNLASYTQANSIYGDLNLTGDNLSRLYDAAMKAETDRMLKEKLWEEVKAGRLNQLPESFVDAKMLELKRRLDDLEVSLAQLTVKFGEENPKVVEVRQQIVVLQQQIADSERSLESKLKADYERALRDEQALKGALERAKDEAGRQNQMSTMYNILKQEVDTATAMYKDFLQKTSEAKVRLAEQHNNLRLIAPALPGQFVGPKRSLVIGFAILLSLSLGAALALLLEYLDTSIKTIDDVSRFLQLPALGVIPAIPLPSGRRSKTGTHALLVGADSSNGGEVGPFTSSDAAAAGSRSSIAEAYRTLRTSVLLAAADVPPKTILFTSSQPGEGKTTSAINTAISLSQLGKRVIVVDCDLRKPRSFKSAGEDAERGLSNYLASDIPLDEVVRHSSTGLLSFLPAGPVPSNPAELVSSDKMRSLLDQLAITYDFVVVDSPPLMCATDPVILSTLVDGVLLVVQGGKTSRQMARHAQQELESVGANIYGVVLNNVDLRGGGYERYYYMRYYSEYTADGVEVGTR